MVVQTLYTVQKECPLSRGFAIAGASPYPGKGVSVTGGN